MQGYTKEFVEGENIQIFSLTQDDTNYHDHNYFELVYIAAGRGIHYLNGEKTIISEGDYFIVDYESIHKYENISGERLELINCLFSPEFINPSLKNCKSFKVLLGDYLIHLGGVILNKVPTKCVFKDTDRSVFEAMKKMKEEYNTKGRGYMEILRCRLVEVLISTIRLVIDDNNPEDSVIEALINYIEENYVSGVSLTEVSRRLGFSPQYLSARFKNFMGITFMEYVQRCRISYACRLLTETDEKIICICEKVGYGDVKFFNSIFKKYLNTSPGNFRKRKTALAPQEPIIEN